MLVVIVVVSTVAVLSAVLAVLRAQIKEEIPGAMVAIFGPPAVSGLGTAGGFKIIIEDRGDLGLDTLQTQVDNLIEKGNNLPQINGVITGMGLSHVVVETEDGRLHVPNSQVLSAAVGPHLAPKREPTPAEQHHASTTQTSAPLTNP